MINSYEPSVIEKNKPPDEDDLVPTGDLDAKLQAIKNAIWEKRPILGEIMQRHGYKTLYEYTLDFLDINPTPTLDARKPELIQVFRGLLAKRLGQEIADQVAKQLAKFSLVSTTDHHATIDDPFFVNSSIITAIPYTQITDLDIRFLVTLSFASVSLNNTSGYARGIQFHGQKNQATCVSRFPIFPDKMKMGVVYNTRAYTKDDLSRMYSEIYKKEKTQEIETDRGALIRNYIKQTFEREHILSGDGLSEQITKINFETWSNFFHNTSTLTPTHSGSLPDLIYFEIETLVRELLLQIHLVNPDSLIYDLIFNHDRVPLLLKHFNNIGGAFSRESGWGTYLFWAVDEKNHRVQLMPKGNKLVSPTGLYQYELTPISIGQALREKKIFPNMMLCYLMVSLYYGMKCLGGFSQVHDLTLTKLAWKNYLEEIGQPDESKSVDPVQTKELGGDGLVLSYLQTRDGQAVPATGIDMAIAEEDTDFERYVEISKQVTLTETMTSMLPDIYAVLYSKTDRDPELEKISSSEILKHTGLVQKILENN